MAEHNLKNHCQKLNRKLAFQLTFESLFLTLVILKFQIEIFLFSQLQCKRIILRISINSSIFPKKTDFDNVRGIMEHLSDHHKTSQFYYQQEMYKSPVSLIVLFE